MSARAWGAITIAVAPDKNALRYFHAAIRLREHSRGYILQLVEFENELHPLSKFRVQFGRCRYHLFRVMTQALSLPERSVKVSWLANAHRLRFPGHLPSFSVFRGTRCAMTQKSRDSCTQPANPDPGTDSRRAQQSSPHAEELTQRQSVIQRPFKTLLGRTGAAYVLLDRYQNRDANMPMPSAISGIPMCSSILPERRSIDMVGSVPTHAKNIQRVVMRPFAPELPSRPGSSQTQTR